MNEMAIEVDGLRRSFGRFEAVKGMSFQVRRGELFALLGTNGAGKSTTIEVLEGLQAPRAGRVSVLGRDPIRDRVRGAPAGAAEPVGLPDPALDAPQRAA